VTVTDLLPRQASTTAQAGWRSWTLVSTVAAVVLVVDQLSKALVLVMLGPGSNGGSIELVPGLLSLLYVENTGAAFGLLQGRNPVLAFVALVVVLVLATWFRGVAAATPWGALALGLQIGGALGNVIDRLRHGFVIDFIDVPYWPTFNLADSAITVGVAILLVVLLRADQQPVAREGDAR
jgi:signal peptidase II